MDQSQQQPPAPGPLKTTEARIQALKALLKKQRTHGQRLLGRWYRVRGIKLSESLQLRMQAALPEFLERPRDRRLFGLPAEGGRALGTQRAEADLAEVRAEMAKLGKREEALAKTLKNAKREEEDARLIIEGQIVSQWREKDSVFAALLEADLPNYFRHPTEFAAVELQVPEGWQPQTPESGASAKDERGSDGSAPESRTARSGLSEPERLEAAPQREQKETVPQKSAPKMGGALPLPAATLPRPLPAPSVPPLAASTATERVGT